MILFITGDLRSNVKNKRPWKYKDLACKKKWSQAGVPARVILDSAGSVIIFALAIYHSGYNGRIELRARGVAQFYYISWKGWRTRMKLRFAWSTRLVRTTAPGNL